MTEETKKIALIYSRRKWWTECMNLNFRSKINWKKKKEHSGNPHPDEHRRPHRHCIIFLILSHVYVAVQDSSSQLGDLYVQFTWHLGGPTHREYSFCEQNSIVTTHTQGTFMSKQTFQTKFLLLMKVHFLHQYFLDVMNRK